VDFVTKPSTDVERGLVAMMMELRTKVKIASTANVAHWKSRRSVPPPVPIDATNALSQSTDKVIAIGASTGGTEAIKNVVAPLPAACPGVVIVQHMPAGFTRMYADRLNTLCAMEVKEAETGDRVMPGRILLAPGDRHMTVIRSGGVYRVDCSKGENVCGHCPSVEVMMRSVANNVGPNAVGVMLTGMGSDGAGGMVAMREAGARTLAQDEATSVVFGMPRVAFERGGAERLVPLQRIAAEILTHVQEC
jgi:two-component system chemotaxis response regulator CheB